MTNELAFYTAEQLLAGYENGDISPVEATKAALDQIAKYDSKLNAFVFVDEEGAMASAKASEARWKKGKPAGLVDGIPTTVKDIMLMKGFATRKGSKLTDPNTPDAVDAPAVERLREQGAVFLGKTTTPEYGWKGVTDSPLSGITRNPWNPEKTPGGSSGGASAACASGMGVLHTGSDGGGSVRIPAAFTGIFGLKPSFGRVPVWPASAFGTVSHVGPMTRTVADGALMLDVMKGYDSRDWYALQSNDLMYRNMLEGSLKGKKIAYSRTLGYAVVDPEIIAAVDAAVDLFRELGADVEEVDPGFESPLEVFGKLWQGGAYFAMQNVDEKHLALLDPGLQQVVENGSKITLPEYLEASVERAELGAKMRAFHDKYELLLTPSLSVTAFDVGMLAPNQMGDDTANWADWTPFSYPFNLTQQPACSVPCGLSSDGLPIGLQIVGPMHRDDLVLQAAAAFERVSPVKGSRPDLSKLL
ncbi:MAG: amidase [Sneathiella sp.]